MCHVPLWWIRSRAVSERTAIVTFLADHPDARVRELLDFPRSVLGVGDVVDTGSFYLMRWRCRRESLATPQALVLFQAHLTPVHPRSSFVDLLLEGRPIIM